MKDKFILNYENLSKLCDKVLVKFPRVKIKIEKSPNKMSNSFYLRFYVSNVSTSLRISDHNTQLTSIGGGIRNLVVDKYTSNGTVVGRLCETIYSLNKKAHNSHLEELFDRIKVQGGNNE